MVNRILQNLVANFNGRTRRESLLGRDYLVAPATLIVPGVLNGSKGPLLYPMDEIEADYTAWNGMPLVAGHPIVNGEHVSARSPNILNKFGIGYVYNSTVENKLAAEAWFDVELTNSRAPLIMEKLLRNEPVELSTGLFTDNIPVHGTPVHNGKSYVAVARNYKPDHLAVFIDQRGACSNADGCGILVNSEGCECATCKAGKACPCEDHSNSNPIEDNQMPVVSKKKKRPVANEDLIVPIYNELMNVPHEELALFVANAASKSKPEEEEEDEEYEEDTEDEESDEDEEPSDNQDFSSLPAQLIPDSPATPESTGTGIFAGTRTPKKPNDRSKIPPPKHRADTAPSREEMLRDRGQKSTENRDYGEFLHPNSPAMKTASAIGSAARAVGGAISSGIQAVRDRLNPYEIRTSERPELPSEKKKRGVKASGSVPAAGSGSSHVDNQHPNPAEPGKSIGAKVKKALKAADSAAGAMFERATGMTPPGVITGTTTRGELESERRARVGGSVRVTSGSTPVGNQHPNPSPRLGGQTEEEYQASNPGSRKRTVLDSLRDALLGSPGPSTGERANPAPHRADTGPSRAEAMQSRKKKPTENESEEDGEGCTENVNPVSALRRVATAVGEGVEKVAGYNPVRERHRSTQISSGTRGGQPATPAGGSIPASGSGTNQTKKPTDNSANSVPQERESTMPLSLQDWINQAPPEGQRVLHHAARIERREKEQVVNRLVANVSAEKRPARTESLMKRDLDELYEMLELIPQSAPVANTAHEGSTVDDHLANYLGAATPVVNRAGASSESSVEEDDISLAVREIDWREEQQRNFSKASA